MRGNILVIDDHQEIFDNLEESLPAHNLFYARDLTGINDTFITKKIDMAIVDLNLKGKRNDDHFSGLDYLRKIRSRFPAVAIMVLSSYRDIERVSTAIRNGADVYEWKDRLVMDTPEFREKINALIKNKKRADQQREHIKAEIVGISPVMEKVRSQVQTFAKTRESFFLIGEKGVLKENVIKFLHFQSAFYAHAREPVSEDMREWNPLELKQVLQIKPSSRQKNFIRDAQDNILFLDHFDSLPADIQEMFEKIQETNRYLHTREPLHIQFVFGLDSDPETLVAKKWLSSVMLHKVPSVKISPLRERKTDIEVLINKWMEVHDYSPTLISSPIRQQFLAYNYPGNESELYSLLEIMLKAHKERYTRNEAYKTKPVDWQDVPATLAHAEHCAFDLKQATARFELTKIEEALHLCEGRKDEVARRLGIKNSDLLKKTYVQKYADKYPLIIKEFPLIVKLYDL